MTLLTIMLFLLGTLVSSTSEAQFAWKIEFVGPEVRASGPASIQLDTEGRPHIVYADVRGATLIYARWTGEEWEANSISVGGLPYGMVRLILDQLDRPHISFFDAASTAVRYAHFDSAAWRLLEVDDSHLAGHSSIALDAEGIPHIAYAWRNGELRFARLVGVSWTIETVDPDVITARFPSLAFGASGRPQIAYYGGGLLLHAEWIGYRWSIDVVDADHSPQFITMHVDPLDVPKVSYRNSQARELRFASWNGSAWIREVVDTDGDVGWDSHMALDSEGDPHISYYDRDRGFLKYSYKDGSTWTTHVVDGGGVVGWWSGIAVGLDGRPHFAYYSWTDQVIKYTVGQFAPGVRVWPAEDVTSTTAVLVGEVTSFGNADRLEVFFEYRPQGENWTRLARVTVSGLGFVSAALDGLEPETSYEYRIIASGGDGEIQGNSLDFTTAPISRPEPLLFLSSLIWISGGVILAALLYVFLLKRRDSKSSAR